MNLSHLNLRVRDPAACRAFYERHFRFTLAFESEDGFFLRDGRRFLLALLPADPYGPLPPGFHVGFTAREPDEVRSCHAALAAAGARTGEVSDYRPDEDYVTFRCWDPDGTEIEVFWDGV